jgi:hypothetical protein
MARGQSKQRVVGWALKLSNNQLIRRAESSRHELDHNNEALVDRHRLRSSFDPLPEYSPQSFIGST